MDNLKGLKRTHSCGELRAKDEGAQVVLMGWVQRRRDHGGVIFIDLRDREGITQIVFDEELSGEAHKKAEKLRSEYVMAVNGKVRLRPGDTANPNMPTGEIEVVANELRILNTAQTPPFQIEDDINVAEDVRLRYRYLDLRRPSLQRNIILRYNVTKAVRRYFDNEGFIDVETPFLTKSTPEGARDYLVPSRVNRGKFFALPQSPQLFKQILMIAGFDKYYQIVKCFRDEDLRADRQPEFTQIDVEMSFVEREDIYRVMEGLMKTVFSEAAGIEIDTPFPRISYEEAMKNYGNDKPDTRFEMKLVDLTETFKQSQFKVFSSVVENNGLISGINAKGFAGMTRKELDDLTEFVKGEGAKGLVWIKVLENELQSPVVKFFSQEEIEDMKNRLGAEAGDLLFIIADESETTYRALSELRLKIGKEKGLIDEKRYDFLWITDFPLLEYDSEEKRYVAMHHPFTSPVDEDISLLDSNPQAVRAKAYDLVLNGSEIGGGSIRIHRNDIQQKMFDLLGIGKEEAEAKFGFLLEALQYGAPPHGGIAFGLDRLVMILAGAESIREVISFPKTQKAVCQMTGAPSEVDEKQLIELGIKLRRSVK
ncbi:MAG: aspartate--tRNA ligase [Candidatus Schekmanbacteria bacterium]|nr:MAG: aspartate--tRNA ligase [Candidatus Schekmanbacteria bacterium]